MEEMANTEDNINRITTVENYFGGSGKTLAKDGRILVGEGILKKECRKEAKLRVFFLFNDVLVYGSILIMKKKYINQHIIPLIGLTMESLPDLEKTQNRWLIKSQMKSFVVSASSLTEKEKWMSHIEHCAKLVELKSGRLSAVEHAAAWIPDKVTDICMRCTKTKFSFTQRRHHCRKCGFVVCGKCCNQKFLIPTIADEPQKVCLLCYKLLLSKERKKLEEQRKSVERPFSFVSDLESSSSDDDHVVSNDDTYDWLQTSFWLSFHN
ncbi:pleckstrin homology domain-containing family F member 1-like [Protopterus annectens]|uniref:pleckstrin homology domain-containing family F member 1-like n=1 Tax=Protopterus annectens TaxID=7888 RepID=UPI001CF99377|nr:pleckstrin homology domain-containing family F member 1-like [Protopterus annectens]XP_043937496.1 pleckstrin homology domain-containing family F member 1-like [Protopterus annectens]